MNIRKKVVIIGAGFGGLWAAESLSKNKNIDVLIIDRNNYHTFLPLLYQVAAGELDPGNIAYPTRSILRKLPNASFFMGEVRDIDFSKKVIKVKETEISYDYLILSLGSVSHYFGIKGAEENSFSLKNLEEGIAIRNHILKTFEKLSHEKDENNRKRALTFTIVGGGATGIEYSGALNELVHNVLVRDFPEISFKKARIILIEATDSVLASMPENLRAYTLENLRKIGIEVLLKSCVTEITPTEVYLKDGTIIPTETVIWTAGVKANPLMKELGLPTIPDGRVKVYPSLQVENCPEIYAVGDLTYYVEDGSPLPMVAQVAMQQGTLAAENIIRQINNEPLKPFRYNDLGSMVTIGRYLAVVKTGNQNYTGFVAWFFWLVVHIVRLIGFRNRLLVLINWGRNYFYYERAGRLILPLKDNTHK